MTVIQKYAAEFDALLLADRTGHRDGGDPLEAIASRWAAYAMAEASGLALQATGRAIVLEDRHGRVASDHFLTGQFVLEIMLGKPPEDQASFAEMLEDSVGRAAVAHLWEGLEAVSTGGVVLLESEDSDTGKALS